MAPWRNFGEKFPVFRVLSKSQIKTPTYAFANPIITNRGHMLIRMLNAIGVVVDAPFISRLFIK